MHRQDCTISNVLDQVDGRRFRGRFYDKFGLEGLGEKSGQGGQGEFENSPIGEANLPEITKRSVASNSAFVGGHRAGENMS